MLGMFSIQMIIQHYHAGGGNMGDAAPCNTQECLHAASIPEEDSFRDMIQFVIHPSKKPIISKEDMFSQEV